jgi:GT2 family glycosyltransferase
VWRADLLKVNGYDNDFVGYGSEDVDLEWRLRAVGLESKSLKGRGCVLHLYHEQRRGTPRNVELLSARQQRNLFRVHNGIVDERAQ